MSRQLDNLKRILRKLQARYGDGDALVSELKDDVELREGVESGYPQWPDANTSTAKSFPAISRSAARTGIQAGHRRR